ncbi:hypothetical protein ACFFQW_46065 [Umezawaea endophytica]|uniref:Uncharacterized protein n=1 Tax=Umezawaea endophytica TaxID=1654476 RepID=A0A9X2VY88_9PSEU|nr:hypothetical protein [Umezawaea endophytica]MCS7484602.1 hypothetical protein [Umezawaea endophytica]
MGDRVGSDWDEHVMVGLANTTVRLRPDIGFEQVALAGHLMLAPDFAVLDGPRLPVVEPFELMPSLLEQIVTEAECRRPLGRGRNQAADDLVGEPSGGGQIQRSSTSDLRSANQSRANHHNTRPNPGGGPQTSIVLTRHLEADQTPEIRGNVRHFQGSRRRAA